MALPPGERPPASGGTPQQFILMPRRRSLAGGLRAWSGGRADSLLRRFATASSTLPPMVLGLPEFLDAITPLRGFGAAGLPPTVADAQIRVVDSIHEDGPKLVELAPAAAAMVPLLQNEVELRPVLPYLPCVRPRLIPTAAPGGGAIRLQIVSAQTGAAIPDARVTVFTAFAQGTGATGATDAQGWISLPLGAGGCLAERLFVVPGASSGHWGHHDQNRPLQNGDQIQLDAVDLSVADGLEHYHGRSTAVGDGEGVRVAVIDSGVGPHPDLVTTSALNSVRGEARSAGEDNGSGHGTHVAGIIAARGQAPGGLRGLAPDAELLSWRVYDQANNPATNYSIIKALIGAIDAGCHVINLSLGLDPASATIDLALTDAIEDANDNGAAVIAAAGNDWQDPVLFPARLDRAVGVTAVGRRGTFPVGCYQDWEMSQRHGTSTDDVFAAFSNIGTSVQRSEVDLIAAGVGILSAMPHGGYVPMSGTSMACAAVTGVTARLLSRNPGIRDAAHDAARSAAIRNLLNSGARSLGFTFQFEGAGLAG